MAMTRVTSINDLKTGETKCYTVNGKRIALFNVGGKFYAMDNSCLHKGGPLGEGDLEDNIITCPWHGWQYDVTSGICMNSPSQKISTYKVSVEGQDIMIEM